MAKVKVYNLKGQEVEQIELSESVFALKANNDLIHQAFIAISSNQRQNLAHTKTRGERAGSGIKPWRQKGTGRARVGSVRTPVWRKGGIVFGPRKERNFKKEINKKMKVQATKMVLSGKLKDKEIIIVDKMELKEKKTKDMKEALDNLKISKSTLIAFSDKEKDLRLTSRNIPGIENILISQLNVKEMLENKYLVMSKDSIKFLEEKYK